MSPNHTELTSLEQILGWMQSNGIPLDQLDLIAQDEFSYELLVPHDGRWVVFGVTWLGDVTAVAVWPHRPSADELLHRRLADGWEPTPTALQEGQRILGHAACLVGKRET